MADEFGVAVGSYTRGAGGYHCLEQCFGLLNGYAARPDTAASPGNTAFVHDGEREYLLESARPEIADSVGKIKTR